MQRGETFSLGGPLSLGKTLPVGVTLFKGFSPENGLPAEKASPAAQNMLDLSRLVSIIVSSAIIFSPLVELDEAMN